MYHYATGDMPRKLRNIVSFDAETGEKIDGAIAIEKPPKLKPQHPYGNFVAVNIHKQPTTINLASSLYQLIGDPEISGETTKVLVALICHLDFNNFVRISLTDIASHLNIHRPNVSRAIKILECKGVIERGEKVGSIYTFRLNPNYSWRGESNDLVMFLTRKNGKSPKNKRKS